VLIHSGSLFEGIQSLGWQGDDFGLNDRRRLVESFQFQKYPVRVEVETGCVFPTANV
jgi:hypothetical protein